MKQKTVIAIRHVYFEDLGSFEKVLFQKGYDVQYVEADLNLLNKVDALKPDLLVILGAPVSVYDQAQFPWILNELKIVQERLSSKKPIIGFCFGAQLIAQAAGGTVFAGKKKEIGWGYLNITDQGINSPVKLLKDTPIFHWHGDTFTLPCSATLLASTDFYENQAFSIGDYCFGFQFHAEIIENKLEQWLIGNALEISITQSVSNDLLRQSTNKCYPMLQKKSENFWNNVLQSMRL